MKILRNIALLLLPIALYYGVFIAFEPNNYFGLRDAPLRGDDIIATLRAYEKAPTPGVVLGDSRVVKLETEPLEAVYGVEFENLAYGGASLAEMLDLAEWTAQHNPGLSHIVLGLSFYTLNAGYNHDRMVVRAVSNPLVYMTNLTYNINMAETLVLSAQNAAARARGEAEIPMGGGEAETRDPESYVYIEAQDPRTGENFSIREDLLAYATDETEGIGGKMANWKLNSAAVERLAAFAAECTAKGVELVVVLPPVDASVHRLVIEPLGIGPPVEAALQTLRAAGATVYDYEIQNDPAYPDSLYYDGFHLDDARGWQVWQQQFIEDLQAYPGGVPTM